MSSVDKDKLLEWLSLLDCFVHYCTINDDELKRSRSETAACLYQVLNEVDRLHPEDVFCIIERIIENPH